MARVVAAATLFGTSWALQSGQAAVPPKMNCPWKGYYREDICYQQPRDQVFLEVHKKQRLARRGLINMTKLDEDVWADLAGMDQAYKEDFFEAFKAIRHLQAADVLATKETWTQFDSEFLRQLTKGANMIGMNNITEPDLRIVKSRLPRLMDLHHQLRNFSVALVGGGSGVFKTRLGTEIDSHDHVVRFGKMRDLHEYTTGLKTTMQVVNAKEEGSNDVALFDFDQGSVLRSYCTRLFEGAKHERAKSRPLFMFTPTAWCKMPKEFASFSQQFLFFWFIGSLSDDVSLYGFSEPFRSRFAGARFQKAEDSVIKNMLSQLQDRMALAGGATIKQPLTMRS